MTVAQLVKRLQTMPQDMLILIERGECGPCEVKDNTPSVQPIHKYHADSPEWCIDFFPECSVDFMDEEVKSQAVIL